MPYILFICLFIFRSLNAFSLATFFQPDEFFQSLEPAHLHAFGYGYLTWEWHNALRSSIHPLMYTLAYKLASRVASESFAVSTAPKLTSAAIAAVSDLYVYKFAGKYWKDSAKAKTALALSLLSAWNWQVATRSFSNNLEMALTAIGLYHWPWHRFKQMSFLKACFFGFLSCVVRPTNALLWGFLGSALIYNNREKPQRLLSLVLPLSFVLVVVLALSSLADLYFYKRWTFPLYNFLEFNIVRNLSLFYGSAPWHFHVFQSVPLMLMGYLPAFLTALYERKHTSLVWACIFVIAAFSVIAHKEFRFLQPIYPIMLVLAADVLSRIRFWRCRWCILSLILAVHGSIAFFFTRVNEVGEIQVIKVLRNDPTVSSIGFLTPCHSTPWHSMLHRKDLVGDSWFLTCEPPLHLSSGTTESLKGYRDQSDLFFDDPRAFLKKLPYKWPSHLIIFEPMEEIVVTELNDYEECMRFFNSYYHWDSRRSGDIIVYCKKSISEVP